jgi:hypothetical protein
MANKTQKSNSRGNAIWGGFGAVASLIGGCGILLVSEKMGDWLTDFFLGLGFNPREEAIICLIITAVVVAAVGFLAGWVLRLLLLKNSTK